MLNYRSELNINKPLAGKGDNIISLLSSSLFSNKLKPLFSLRLFLYFSHSSVPSVLRKLNVLVHVHASHSAYSEVFMNIVLCIVLLFLIPTGE